MVSKSRFKKLLVIRMRKFCLAQELQKNTAQPFTQLVIFQMIIDMIDPTNYNNNSLKDEFLGNIYRIVECCGADGYKDYTDRFDMSPHKECSDHR